MGAALRFQISPDLGIFIHGIGRAASTVAVGLAQNLASHPLPGRGREVAGPIEGVRVVFDNGRRRWIAQVLHQVACHPIGGIIGVGISVGYGLGQRLKQDVVAFCQAVVVSVPAVGEEGERVGGALVIEADGTADAVVSYDLGQDGLRRRFRNSMRWTHCPSFNRCID